MKNLYVLPFIFLLFTCQQPNKKKESSTIISETLPSNNNFNSFLEKFTKDSIFQLNHVDFPLKVREIDPHTLKLNDHLIQKDNYQLKSFNNHQSPDYSSFNSFDQFINIKNEQVIIEHIGIENGLSIIYEFKLINGEWKLITWTDRST